MYVKNISELTKNNGLSESFCNIVRVSSRFLIISWRTITTHHVITLVLLKNSFIFLWLQVSTARNIFVSIFWTTQTRRKIFFLVLKSFGIEKLIYPMLDVLIVFYCLVFARSSSETDAFSPDKYPRKIYDSPFVLKHSFILRDILVIMTEHHFIRDREGAFWFNILLIMFYYVIYF